MNISRTRYLVCIAIFSAISFVLMYLDFSIPAIIPGFVKMDFSELPALISAFSLGPLAGVLVCFFKNLIHLAITTTSGVGELANFILGAVFTASTGFIYKYKKTRLNALIACLLGSIIMAIISFPVNLFISYPFYYNFMPKQVIISMYQQILKSADSIEKCLLIFNVPFNLLKCVIVSIITFFIYKPLSPIIKGYNKQKNIKDVENIEEDNSSLPS